MAPRAKSTINKFKSVKDWRKTHVKHRATILPKTIINISELTRRSTEVVPVSLSAVLPILTMLEVIEVEEPMITDKQQVWLTKTANNIAKEHELLDSRGEKKCSSTECTSGLFLLSALASNEIYLEPKLRQNDSSLSKPLEAENEHRDDEWDVSSEASEYLQLQEGLELELGKGIDVLSVVKTQSHRYTYHDIFGSDEEDENDGEETSQTLDGMSNAVDAVASESSMVAEDVPSEATGSNIDDDCVSVIESDFSDVFDEFGEMVDVCWRDNSPETLCENNTGEEDDEVCEVGDTAISYQTRVLYDSLMASRNLPSSKLHDVQLTEFRRHILSFVA
ncbi:hypothetical protein BCR33DRAFT_858505 [Rhizoclosmatium globosum]|uniref:Uncharacterized protein n=1 Tax=Rhizoclosmatium globosum TaxID=329046 RepID=A0A1Y2AXU3_9FUNG|nr:hypothetical protein BCR33DRAFT_858505 [Rhizoclosmatium globosum]|eukprot:ORY27274.1 hypothetical protein BCR33DRAFT_858505 [Rhizoclosmatium globosum]